MFNNSTLKYFFIAEESESNLEIMKTKVIIFMEH